MSQFRAILRWMPLVLLAPIWVAFAGCSRGSSPDDDAPVRVLVSIAPLQGLARAVAPEGAEVQTLVPPGESVHGYQLRPEDRAHVARADLVVMVGLGLEGGASALLLEAGDRLVRFDHVVGLEDEHAGHDHAGHDHDHDHTIDPHLWLDPQLVLRLVSELESRLASIPGVDRGALAQRAEDLRERIARLDERYKERLAPLRGSAIITHHDAWSRLADRYGLRVAAILRPVATGEPTPRELALAREAIEREGVRMIFVEPQFDASLARRLGETSGVRIGVLDPIGSGDWFEMMEANLEVLVEGLAPPGEVSPEQEAGEGP
ncbi:MAG: metal ABC transporter substrate-binding protein [Phycisphaerales bacterium JB059]